VTVPRYTARGGPEVEARIHDILAEVSTLIAGLTSKSEIRSVVLIGGYGRGEGGVEVVDGVERPHNNLDILLIARGYADRGDEDMRRRVAEAVRPLAARAGIGIDVGVVAAGTLLHSPCRLMWYDMRYGHRTILGDQRYVPSLRRFEADRIPPDEARDLLVNRGTLLVINDEVLARGEPAGEERRVVVRHAVKAIIGYGDALLLSRGAYHWSYEERQRLMSRQAGLPSDLLDLYHRAMEFRFRPDYAAWSGMDLRRWSRELRPALEAIHRRVESWRLGIQSMAWREYPDAALRAGFAWSTLTPREALRRARALLASRACPGRPPFPTALAWRVATARDLIGLAFPVVAFGVADERYRDMAAAAVGSPSGDDAVLRRAFLSAWAVHGDPNFGAVARKLGIDLYAGGGR